MPSARKQAVIHTDAKFGAADAPALRMSGARFEDCSFEGCAFRERDLKGARFVDRSFVGTEALATAAACGLSRSQTVEGELFRGSTLTGAEFVQSDLRGADFRDVVDHTLNPRENRVEGARFSLPDAVTLLTGFGVIVE